MRSRARHRAEGQGVARLCLESQQVTACCDRAVTLLHNKFAC